MKRKQIKRKQIKRKHIILVVIFVVLVVVFIEQNKSSYYIGEIDTEKIDDNVLNLKPKIEDEMKKQNLNKYYTPFILAIVNQESRGRGTDPFQASESKCGRIGCITDIDESVEAGVKAFKGRIKYATKSGFKRPSFEMLAQAYNYGNGYIDYLNENGYDDWTQANAKDFSKKMCGRAGTNHATAVNKDKKACYGDYNYVKRVSQFLIME